MLKSFGISKALKDECFEKNHKVEIAMAHCLHNLQIPHYEITEDEYINEILRNSYIDEWRGKFERYKVGSASIKSYYNNLINQAEREENGNLFKDAKQNIRRANVSYDLLKWMVNNKKYLGAGNTCAYDTVRAMIKSLGSKHYAFMQDFYIGNNTRIQNMCYAEFILDIWNLYIDNASTEKSKHERKDSETALKDSIGWSIQVNLAEFVLFLDLNFPFRIILEVDSGYGIEIYKTSGYEGIADTLGYIKLIYSPEYSVGHFTWETAPHIHASCAIRYQYLKY